jgi:hypothetical protein
MIDFGITVNTTQFEAAMQRLKAGAQAGILDPKYGTLPVQARLLAERCREFTPPRDVGQGKAAVARDLTRIFKPLTHTTFLNEGLRKIIRTDNRAAWNKASANFGDSHNLKNTKAIGFSESWHNANRISRGRARGLSTRAGKAPKDNLGVVTLGPEARKSREYIAKKKKMVGWARSGWNAAIWGLGGQLGPSWVSKHGTQGRLINGTAATNPFIQVINDTSWAKYGQGEGNRIIRNAIQARARDMESYYFRMMRLAAKTADPQAAAYPQAA